MPYFNLTRLYEPIKTFIGYQEYFYWASLCDKETFCRWPLQIVLVGFENICAPIVMESPYRRKTAQFKIVVYDDDDGGIRHDYINRTKLSKKNQHQHETFSAQLRVDEIMELLKECFPFSISILGDSC